MLSCDRVRRSKIDIVDRGELGGRNIGVKPGVIAADMSDPNNADAKFFHRSNNRRELRAGSNQMDGRGRRGDSRPKNLWGTTARTPPTHASHVTFSKNQS